MIAQKLKTVFLGVDQRNQQWLEALAESGHFELISIAGTRPDVLQSSTARFGCPGFDDYRQLIVLNECDVLFAAAPSYMAREHINAAMKKKFNIIKVPPPGLDFENVCEFTRTAKKEGVGYYIVCPLRFSPGFELLGQTAGSDQTKDTRFIEAVCNVPDESESENDRWLSDPLMAGGGVLLQNSYELMDQIVHNFGLPQRVYCLMTNRAPDKQQRLSTTEDTAVLTMRFSDTLVCTLAASREFGPPGIQLRLLRHNHCQCFTPQGCTVMDNAGKILNQSGSEISPQHLRIKALEDIAISITQQPGRAGVFHERQLKAASVIQAAYMSAKTSMPEEPQRILEMAKT